MLFNPIRQATMTLLLIAPFILLMGCNKVSPAVQKPSVATTVIPSMVMQPATKMQADLSPAMQIVSGDYVTSDYAKRTQGYDWVGVTISAVDNENITIKVRSRSDIKQPTCRFDGTAKLIGQDNAHGVIFKTVANDSVTFLQFQNAKLTIEAQDKYALNYFCSGGATLAGDYEKLADNLELN